MVLYQKEGVMSSPTPAALLVGVDIAAASFTAAWSAKPRTFAQAPEGVETFLAALHAAGAVPARTRVVMEATGSYWVMLAVALHAAGYAVSVLNPAQVYHYRQSRPRRAKTDDQDSLLLRQLGQERPDLPTWTPPDPVYHELRQRLRVRESLIAMRQQARNQRHALAQWPVQVQSPLDQLDAVIADLDTRIRTLEQEIASTLASGAWAESAALLQSIPGIGLISSAWLLVGTLAFTVADTVEGLTGYAGLAPVRQDSGTSVRGHAPLRRGGNRHIRTVLYMASISAQVHNPVIHSFYSRLIGAGKPSKVARLAAARKLLHIAWAVVTKRRRFDPAYSQRPGVPAHAEAGHTPD
jgi:transposase